MAKVSQRQHTPRSYSCCFYRITLINCCSINCEPRIYRNPFLYCLSTVIRVPLFAGLFSLYNCPLLPLMFFNPEIFLRLFCSSFSLIMDFFHFFGI